jgi:hypothetical protein
VSEESEKGTGRPKRTAPPRTVEMRAVDGATYRMLDTLASYGRFGDSVPAVGLFIIRTWLWDNEDRLREAIRERGEPLGHVIPESESGD